MAVTDWNNVSGIPIIPIIIWPCVSSTIYVMHIKQLSHLKAGLLHNRLTLSDLYTDRECHLIVFAGATIDSGSLFILSSLCSSLEDLVPVDFFCICQVYWHISLNQPRCVDSLHHQAVSTQHAWFCLVECEISASMLRNDNKCKSIFIIQTNWIRKGFIPARMG